MPDKKEPVIIVGSGWAGLSCAIELSFVGHEVILLESARQLGGRARRVAFGEVPVDNGQHVFLGAYRQTLSLLKRLNISESGALQRDSLDLHLMTRQNSHFHLKIPALIAPLNLLSGLILSSGFSLKDKWRAIVFGIKLFTNAVILEEDISAAELLARQGQTETLIRALWEPICLASLNTPLDEASAIIFIRVLHDTFCRNRKDAELIIPKVDLGKLLPDPAADFIEQHSGRIHLNHRVTELVIDRRRIRGVICGDKTYEANHVVLAIPPHACSQLLKSHPALHDLAYNLSAFSYNPIVTIYLKYAKNVRPDRPVQALLDNTAQWIIDRSLVGQPGILAVVISGPGDHMQLNNDELAELIQGELSHCFPHWPRANDVMVIREKRATFSSRVNINSLRPDNVTPVDGLWLCGDYTSTGYPATIESSVLSGKRAAELIQQK